MRRLFSALVITFATLSATAEDAVVSVESLDQSNRGDAMTLRMDDREYILRIEPYSVRAPGMVVRVCGNPGQTGLRVLQRNGHYTDYDPGPVRTFRGNLLDSVTGSQRGSVTGILAVDGGLTAEIKLEREDGGIWIAPRRVAGKIEHYRVGRAAVDEPMCLVESDSAVLRKLPNAVAPAAAPTDLFCANLGIDMDDEYYSHFSSIEDAVAWVELLVATANLQYEHQVQIAHRLPLIVIHTDDNHPHNNGGTIFTDAFAEWSTDHDAVDWDFVHILTGLDLPGLGFGFIGSVCRSSGSPFSRSEYTDNVALASHLLEHELAHNWDAVHCVCGRGTMIASSNQTHLLQFTQESIDQIIAYRDTRPCLEICEQISIIRRDLPFEDDFEANSLDPEIWAQQDSVSLGQDGDDQFVSIAVDGALGSVSFDTLTLFAVDLEYEWLAEAGESGTLLVEFLDRSYRWQTVTTHPASDSGGTWQAESVRLYGDARVFNATADTRDFQLRLTATGGSFALDDVRIIPYQFNPCPEDCEPNEVVNIDDLFFVVFQAGNPEADPGCDVTPQFPDGSFGDGDVDIDDILAVIAAFGPCE